MSNTDCGVKELSYTPPEFCEDEGGEAVVVGALVLEWVVGVGVDDGAGVVGSFSMFAGGLEEGSSSPSSQSQVPFSPVGSGLHSSGREERLWPALTTKNVSRALVGKEISGIQGVQQVLKKAVLCLYSQSRAM